jgi:hypothetical protein
VEGVVGFSDKSQQQQPPQQQIGPVVDEAWARGQVREVLGQRKRHAAVVAAAASGAMQAQPPPGKSAKLQPAAPDHAIREHLDDIDSLIHRRIQQLGRS